MLILSIKRLGNVEGNNMGYKCIKTDNGVEIISEEIRYGTKYGVPVYSKYGDSRPSDDNPLIDGVKTLSEIRGRITYLEDFFINIG
jgi:hypothetical protein